MMNAMVKVAASIALTAALAFAAGCASREPQPEASPVNGHPAVGQGAELWAANCMRCHNLRYPDSYGDAEWSVVMSHMRLRANLPGEDARAILEFLQGGF